eukprot:CAMPEP_0202857430 /NCGR_PEP_ID=MMETSP1391-20130828/372_1 /ASSEMBLY_ACC=CAM_ASM_000867 /TAXON_ID=1034604 /ORGANISM="Chlamydomonas leiostraca, Strain SAG 11-49" /LENGTH=135 /DNA_ID=CAMNT_0049536225 /DNA_START=67 /DNA_END=474 /DNA_ORIENTATION=+
MKSFRPAAFSSAVRPAVRTPRAMVISASYKNKENIDLSNLSKQARHEKDTGSAEYQIALATARIQQISKHLSTNRKDHAAKRGLISILSQRKSLLQYLYRENRDAYDRLITEFGIRGVVTSDTRGASREKTEVVA